MNKLLLSIALLVSITALKAQNLFVPKIGLSGNYNTETRGGYTTTPRPGFLAGFGYNMNMSDHLSFQPEIYYVSKNFKLQGSTTQAGLGGTTFTTLDFSDQYRLSYLEIPALFKYKIKHEKMFLILGPYLAVGLEGTYKGYQTTVDGSGQVTTLRHTFPIAFEKQSVAANNFGQIVNHRVDFGFQAGVGYVLPHGLLLDLRFDLGTISMFSSQGSRNQTLMLTLALPILRHTDEEE